MRMEVTRKTGSSIASRREEGQRIGVAEQSSQLRRRWHLCGHRGRAASSRKRACEGAWVAGSVLAVCEWGREAHAQDRKPAEAATDADAGTVSGAPRDADPPSQRRRVLESSSRAVSRTPCTPAPPCPPRPRPSSASPSTPPPPAPRRPPPTASASSPPTPTSARTAAKQSLTSSAPVSAPPCVRSLPPSSSRRPRAHPRIPFPPCR